ncbi:General substrate transporter [Cynara cardunculus var. scolymus]|uniref:General substrate transporter n=1 Tax=Cynara cardunculus var. scolymus TaxID=59895 RepID=A0A118K790_CYNCS|nr:General substrate transporter [Cynara cardunculus var. scolymus]
MPAQVMAVSGGAAQDLPARLTGQVIICTIIAAFGGLMFGYDIGISGGVTSMDVFLKKFFPGVYVKKHHAKEDNYCKFDDQYLQLFTSSLYLAAVVSSFFASKCCTKFGRRITIQLASLNFLTGVVLNACAMNISMLIIGRLFLGFGIGFGNQKYNYLYVEYNVQAVPLFISEIAPVKYRGGLNVCFQMLVTVGILCANVINYFTASHPWGWRISLGGAAVPALFLALGSLIIVETPTSLIERGQAEKGYATLQKIRGVRDVQKEYDEIAYATELSKQIKHPFKNLLKRSSRPQVVCSMILQVFQQFTGINVIMFYAPVLFQTMGFGSDASLLSAVVTGSVNSLATLVAVFGVDKLGRRLLLIEAAIQMLIAQKYAYVVLFLICFFVSGFAWSWGPLGWLIPSEIFPLEIRTSGFFCAVSMNMIFTFIIAQAFLTMLCHMRAGIFFFFSVWIVIMGIYAYSFLPETKGIPIDEMNEKAWKKHWFWKRYFSQERDQIPDKA